MSPTRPARYAPPRSRAARSRRWLPSILLLAGTLACAEGSRSLYPAAYAGARGAMEIGGDRLVFVYARQGEYVLLGSRNRGSGGDILVHAPQASAGTADDASSATADFRCSSQRGRGAIAGRAQELAGPHSADGTSSVRDGFAPCWYVAPRSGLYGVRFTSATRGARGNDGSLAHPPVLAGFVSAWDVSVRSGAGSLADLDGRVFAHALCSTQAPAAVSTAVSTSCRRTAIATAGPSVATRKAVRRSKRTGRTTRAASGLFQRRRAGRAERHRGRPRAWRASPLRCSRPHRG